MNSMENQTKTWSNEEDEIYATQVASASVFPMVLKAAIELGVLEIIERAGHGAQLSASQILAQLPTRNMNQDVQNPVLLDRILRLLAAHSILICSLAPPNQDAQVQRCYGLAPVSKYFLKNEHGGSLGPFFQFIQDKVYVDMWCNLKDSVLEGGIPFNRAYGMSMGEYVSKDTRLYEIFKSAMSEFNILLTTKILEIYKGFEGLKLLVDVGGGNGSILNMIISKYPNIKGINFDLPAVIESSPSYPGIEHVAGDMFVSIPKGDAIFIKWVLHTFDDQHCIKILRNCYEALPDQGKVLVVDLLIPEAPETRLAHKSLFQYDLFMTHKQERTQTDLEGLAMAAGFSGIRVACCAYNYSLVEFYKNM